MKKVLFLSLAALICSFSSCTNDDLEGVNRVTENLSAIIVDGESRTVLDGLQVKWGQTEAISVFYTSDIYAEPQNLECTMTNGAGTTSANFSIVLEGDNPVKLAALYPYLSTSTYSDNGITLTMPETHQYVENGISGAPMAALMSNNSELISFKNAGALLGVTVNNIPAGYDRATLVSSTKAIAGECQITFDANGNPTLKTTTNATGKQIDIEFTASNTLSNKTFYFPIPVDEYTSLEMSISISTDQSSKKVLKTKALSAERSNRYKSTLTLDAVTGTIPKETTIEEASNALKTNNNITVNEVSSTDQNPTITLPVETANNEVNIVFESITATDAIKIDAADDSQVASTVNITVPTEANQAKLNIDLPNTTVKITVAGTSGTISDLTATTAEETLIIGKGVSVGNLTVEAGNVRIEDNGSVNNITNNSGKTIYVIYEAATKPEVKINQGDVEFMSAAEWDLRKAIKQGGEYTLKSDVTLTNTLYIDNSVILNLDGKTISGTATSASASNLFTVNPGVNLTIKNGTIWSAATNPDTEWGGEGQPPYPGYANNTISNRGTLTIDNAKIENKTSAGGASYVIDNYDGGSLTVNSGEIIQSGNDVAIRMFASSANNANNVTINGGTITGKRGVWIQLAGSDTNVAPNVNLNITNGTLTGSLDSSDNILAIYSYSYGNDMKNVKINISGGTFNGDIALTGGKNKTNIESLTITDGTFNGRWGDAYSYGEDNLAAAAIKITGGNFSHLYPLTYMDGDNGNINVTLAKEFKVGDAEDDDMDGPIVVSAGNTVTLDLNGKTISQTSDTPVSMITNNGNLTIKDSSNGSGKINFTFNGTVNNGIAANAISNRGTLVVEGGEISNQGTGDQIGYAIDNYNGSTLTIDGGKITASGSSYYDGIRLFCSSNEITVTVNNGTISTIWAQNPSDNKASEVEGTVIINGGTVNTIYYENYTTVKVKTGVTATVTPYGAGKDNTTTTEEDGYTIYSFVHNEE